MRTGLNVELKHPDFSLVVQASGGRHHPPDGGLAPPDCCTDAFVYRPGGKPGPNVYVNFPALAAALSSTDGLRLLEFDDSIEPIVLPTGTFDMALVVWTGLAPRDQFRAPKVVIPEGCYLPGLRMIGGQVDVECRASLTPTVPASDFAPGGHGTVIQFGARLDAGVTFVRCTGGAPLFDIGNTPVNVVLTSGEINLPSGQPPDVAPVFRVGASGRLTMRLQAFSQLGPRVVDGVPESRWDLDLHSPGMFANDQSTFAGTLTVRTPNSRSRSRILPQGVRGMAPAPATAAIVSGVQTGDTLLFDTTGLSADVRQILPNVAESFVSQGARLNTAGFDLTIKHVKGDRRVVVEAPPNHTIDGLAEVSLGPGEALTVRSDGVATYYVVSRYSPAP